MQPKYNIDPATGEVLNHKSYPLDEFGRELLDPTPMQPPAGYKKQESMFEIVRRMVRSEKLALEAQKLGAETFEEANDFDVGDDFEPETPYETEELDGMVDELIRNPPAPPEKPSEKPAQVEKSEPDKKTPSEQKTEKSSGTS